MDQTIEDVSQGQARNLASRPGPDQPALIVRQETAPDQDTLARWDALVERGGGSDVTQFSAWARIRECAGYTPTYLFAYRDDRLVGGAMVLSRRAFGMIKVGYLPYGPVVAPELADRAEVMALLVNALTRLAAKLTVFFVQPPEGGEQITAGLLASGFRVSNAGIAPSGSYRLDLTRPLDEIRGGFSKRLKSWTNRWAAKGVKVRQGDENDLPLLVGLMRHTGDRQGFRPPPLEYVRTLYRELAPDGRAAIFIGEVNGTPVSADLVTVCGGMIRGRLGGFNSSGDAGKLSVPAAARWEIIQWGRRNGHRYLDFGGLPERMLSDMIDRGMHSNDEWPSAQRGKLAFNGTPFRYPAPVELVRPVAFRAGYDLLRNNPRGERLLGWAKGQLRSQFRGNTQCDNR
jgi:lipid II:glycine glycyltransferase (peptidoglycan interpeptide bridge formation enzyme)